MTTLPRTSMTDSLAASLPLADPGARRASGSASGSAAPPNPEVVPVAHRRRFSSADKQRILEAADRCTQPGEIGALLRREAIYSSLLSTWRGQRRKAQREALKPQRRGPKPDAVLAENRHSEQLTRENVRLRSELERAHTIIDVQKKLCTLLGLPTAPQIDEDN